MISRRMPLQKLPPNGPLSVSAPAGQRPQMQNRRRTLQTISELSTPDGGLPDFVSSIGIESIRRMGHDNMPGVGRSTPKAVKRQSLLQPHPSPVIQPSSAVTPAHSQETSTSQPTQSRRPMPMTTDQVDGWNAKRERARMRQEQAIAEAQARQSASGQASAPVMSADRLSVSSRPSSMRHASSQQTLRRESSTGSFPANQGERRASSGTTTNMHHDDARPAASERASTDASSYRSRDSAINRSRSGSSNTSYTSQDAPPLPRGNTPDMRGYCAELILQNQNLVAFGESARSKNPRPGRSSRTLSLPTNGFTHTAHAPHRYVTAHDLRALPPQHHNQHQHQHPRPISAQHARNQALAALTAANSHAQGTRRDPSSPPPHSAHPHNRHASLTSHPPGPARRATAPLPSRRSERRVSFEARTVPRRESLTQWKQERDEAREARGGSTEQRARVQERVRRANEMEREREKELVEMGKRGAGDEESRSCFGGLLAAVWGRSG